MQLAHLRGDVRSLIMPMQREDEELERAKSPYALAYTAACSSSLKHEIFIAVQGRIARYVARATNRNMNIGVYVLRAVLYTLCLCITSEVGYQVQTLSPEQRCL